MTPDVFQQNRILRSFTAEQRGACESQFHRVSLVRGEVLQDEEESITKVSFPLEGLISHTIMLREGESVETAMIGREGASGTLAIASVTSFTRSVVQIPGAAVQIRVGHFLDFYTSCPIFRQAVVRFNSALVAQIQQNMACVARHDAIAKTCRWLLNAHARIDDSRLAITQDMLAKALNLHRATVIETLATLVEKNIIRSHRGIIELADVEGLRSHACECHDRIIGRYNDVCGG